MRAFAGLVLGIGGSAWLGANGQSAFWLLPIAVLFTLTQNWNVKFNLLMDRRTSGGHIRAVIYVLVLPTLLMWGMLLIPYFAGQWIWHRI